MEEVSQRKMPSNLFFCIHLDYSDTYWLEWGKNYWERGTWETKNYSNSSIRYSDWLLITKREREIHPHSLHVTCCGFICVIIFFNITGFPDSEHYDFIQWASTAYCVWERVLGLQRGKSHSSAFVFCVNEWKCLLSISVLCVCCYIITWEGPTAWVLTLS